MINIWGICEFSEMTHDPLRRWDFSCSSFDPVEPARVEGAENYCANCIHWLAPDEKLNP